MHPFRRWSPLFFLPLFFLLTALLPAQVRPPAVITRIDPEYSAEATRARVQGNVVLSIVVGKDGKPGDIRVLRPIGFGLDEQALAAAANWLFKPGTKDGNAVAVRAQVEMSFKLFGKDPEDHSGQLSRLNFTLPSGASRPELLSGTLPGNPAAPGDRSIQVGLQVDTDGTTKNVTVLASTDPAWERDVLNVIRAWRFRPAQVESLPVAVEGVFEIEHYEPPPAPEPQIMQPPVPVPGAVRQTARLRNRNNTKT